MKERSESRYSLPVDEEDKDALKMNSYGDLPQESKDEFQNEYLEEQYGGCKEGEDISEPPQIKSAEKSYVSVGSTVIQGDITQLEKEKPSSPLLDKRT